MTLTATKIALCEETMHKKTLTSLKVENQRVLHVVTKYLVFRNVVLTPAHLLRGGGVSFFFFVFIFYEVISMVKELLRFA